MSSWLIDGGLDDISVVTSISGAACARAIAQVRLPIRQNQPLSTAHTTASSIPSLIQRPGAGHDMLVVGSSSGKIHALLGYEKVVELSQSCENSNSTSHGDRPPLFRRPHSAADSSSASSSSRRHQQRGVRGCCVAAWCGSGDDCLYVATSDQISSASLPTTTTTVIAGVQKPTLSICRYSCAALHRFAASYVKNTVPLALSPLDAATSRIPSNALCLYPFSVPSCAVPFSAKKVTRRFLLVSFQSLYSVSVVDVTEQPDDDATLTQQLATGSRGSGPEQGSSSNGLVATLRGKHFRSAVLCCHCYHREHDRTPSLVFVLGCANGHVVLIIYSIAEDRAHVSECLINGPVSDVRLFSVYTELPSEVETARTEVLRIARLDAQRKAEKLAARENLLSVHSEEQQQATTTAAMTTMADARAGFRNDVKDPVFLVTLDAMANAYVFTSVTTFGLTRFHKILDEFLFPPRASSKAVEQFANHTISAGLGSSLHEDEEEETSAAVSPSHQQKGGLIKSIKRFMSSNLLVRSQVQPETTMGRSGAAVSASTSQPASPASAVSPTTAQLQQQLQHPQHHSTRHIPFVVSNEALSSPYNSEFGSSVPNEESPPHQQPVAKRAAGGGGGSSSSAAAVPGWAAGPTLGRGCVAVAVRDLDNDGVNELLVSTLGSVVAVCKLDRCYAAAAAGEGTAQSHSTPLSGSPQGANQHSNNDNDNDNDNNNSVPMKYRVTARYETRNPLFSLDFLDMLGNGHERLVITSSQHVLVAPAGPLPRQQINDATMVDVKVRALAYLLGCETYPRVFPLGNHLCEEGGQRHDGDTQQAQHDTPTIVVGPTDESGEERT